MAEVQLVWFKRDLRVDDHEALVAAAAQGPCICLFIYEPVVLHADDFDPSHLVFINDGLADLKDRLRALGNELIIRVGQAVEVLEALRKQTGFVAIHSHQETGNDVTYRRDIEVGRWARSHNVEWHEYQQHGVFRKLSDRDGWASRWVQIMRSRAFRTPESVHAVSEVPAGNILNEKDLGLPESGRTIVQRGGEALGMSVLREFLLQRGERYQTEMSSPNTAITSCSRLSPYLAYGNISMRTVLQATEARQAQVRARPRVRGQKSTWRSSLSSFAKRLRWHCHFIQKLESQPSLEFQNMARVYDGLRENDFREDWFEAWQAGQTGYPMVDACMRSLHATGWINFRMRAMLVSFASYHLWLDWRPTSVFLARHFIDYEPGIHYSQFQMQSGTTGINSVRIYSPIKQVHDQDPNGEFIKTWIPELRGVPTEHIAQPERMTVHEQSRYGCQLGVDYPRPLVEHRAAVKAAKERIYAVRRRAESKREAQAVYARHGSRRRPDRR